MLTFSRMQRLESMCEERDGSSQVPVAEGWVVERAYTRLTVRRERAPGPAVSMEVPVPGVIDIAEWGIQVCAEKGTGFRKATAVECWLNAAADALVVRSWQPGDRMNPGGMTGSVKLQDVFVDRKVPQAQRDRVPIFVCGDEIVWVPGYRVARGWEVPGPQAPSVHLSLVAI